MLDAVPDLPRITVDELQLRALAQGCALDVAALALECVPDEKVALLDTLGRLIAIGQGDGSRAIHPRKVLM
jgi:hypothetical protein